jgi:hypothetical protein
MSCLFRTWYKPHHNGFNLDIIAGQYYKSEAHVRVYWEGRGGRAFLPNISWFPNHRRLLDYLYRHSALLLPLLPLFSSSPSTFYIFSSFQSLRI